MDTIGLITRIYMITFVHTKDACEHKSIVYTGGNLCNGRTNKREPHIHTNLCNVVYASLGHETTLYMCAVKIFEVRVFRIDLSCKLLLSKHCQPLIYCILSFHTETLDKVMIEKTSLRNFLQSILMN